MPQKCTNIDAERAFPVQVGAILPLRIPAHQFRRRIWCEGWSHAAVSLTLVVATWQSNQHCEEISGSQCETLIKIAVITARLQLWFASFATSAGPHEEEPIWMTTDPQCRGASAAARARSRTCDYLQTVLGFPCVISYNPHLDISFCFSSVLFCFVFFGLHVIN